MQSYSCDAPIPVSIILPTASAGDLEKIHPSSGDHKKLVDLTLPWEGSDGTPKKKSDTRRSRKSRTLSSLSSSSSTNCKPPRRKRTRFLTDKDGDVIPTYHTSSLSYDDAYHCHEIMWWTENEIAAIHCSALKACDFIVHFRRDQVAIIETLVAACARPGANRKTLASHGVTRSSACRGLESAVAGVLRHRRRRTIAQVLRHQERLRGTCSSSVDRAHLLAVKYRQDTVYASLWAQIIADGDIMAMEHDYDDDSL